MDSIFSIRRRVFLEKLRNLQIEEALVSNPLNIYYLSGVKITPYERFYSLLFKPSDGSCIFIVPDLEKKLKVEPGIIIKFYRDDENPIGLLVNELGEIGSLGLELNYMTIAIYNQIRAGIGEVTLHDTANLISEMRLCKDASEIGKIKSAVQYSDQILAELTGIIREGCSEKELWQRIFNLMSSMQGVSSETPVIQILCGERTSQPHGYSGDYKVKRSEPVSVDFGVCFEHYWSDCTRTFFTSMPDKRFEEIYGIVLEAQLTAIDAVKPGVAIRDIDLAARNVIQKAGYADYFIHRTGHGLGIDIHELPKISKQNDILLEEGMVFTIEPGVYIPGFGGVRIEDDVVVTGSGAMVLNGFSKEFKSMVLGQ